MILLKLQVYLQMVITAIQATQLVSRYPIRKSPMAGDRYATEKHSLDMIIIYNKQ